ncbi:helix-turn-helix domain-containing protein [Patescibacteria group bacterium]|nr:helix-turn-helix domain-containing protein [Patescibacteria group bacterium]
MTTKDKLLTIKEVAEFLRVSERSVTRYIEAGRLKASKVGWWRIKQSDLDDFLKKTSNVNNKKR